VLQVLKKLEFTICSLGQDWGAEGFHNLLYGHILSSEQVFSRAMHIESVSADHQTERRHIPDETKCAHANGLKIRIPARVSEPTAAPHDDPAYLDVISNVVPKI
jgi:hypothetical protein